eukprot:XP_001609929.1 membrane protein [Babesia bovis T2Bo]
MYMRYIPWLVGFLSTCFTAKFEGCDVVVDSSICITNGNTIVLPKSHRNGRLLHYTFDEDIAVDSSGNGNHAIGALIGRSGFGGVGNAAYFRKNFIYLNDSQLLHVREFTVAFFIFLLMDEVSITNAQKVNSYCPIVHKGIRNSSISECSPEVAINPKDGRLRILLSVESNHTMEIDSNYRLQPHQWYHITVVKDNATVTLYINGIVDFVYSTKGASPYLSMCDVPMLIDEFSIYSRALGRDEIQAEASSVMGGIEPSYITVGCSNCGKQEAMESCPHGYHLCNKFELYTGGYKAALRLSIPPNTIMAAASAEPSYGVALCCANLQD